MSDAEWEVAKTVCTPLQVTAIGYRNQQMSWRRIARLMGRDPKTIRDHVEAGYRRLEDALTKGAA